MKMEKGQKCLAVVRVRGASNVRREVQDTLGMLSLTRNCHATLVDDRLSYSGMLQKAQSYVTWGEASKETVALLLKERGRSIRNERLDDEYARKAGYDSLDKLAEAIHRLDVQFRSLRDIKPVFRLHPPRKGFKRSVKKSYRGNGETGYRGEAVNDLIKRMT